jgi:hypothetical protein
MRTNLLQSDGNLKIKRLLGACGMDQNRGFQTPSSKSSSNARRDIVLALLGGFLLLEKKKERRRKKFASLFIVLLDDFFFFFFSTIYGDISFQETVEKTNSQVC